MTAIEPPFTQHWSWHLNQRKPFSSELDQFSIRINFAFQSIAVFKKRNYFTCYFPHNLNDLQFVNIVTASIRFGIQLVGSGCEGWKEKVQHHLSSPAKTNGTLIHLVFLFFIFLHLISSTFSVSYPPPSGHCLDHCTSLFTCHILVPMSVDFCYLEQFAIYITSHCPQNVYHPCRK